MFTAMMNFMFTILEWFAAFVDYIADDWDWEKNCWDGVTVAITPASRKMARKHWMGNTWDWKPFKTMCLLKIKRKHQTDVFRILFLWLGWEDSAAGIQPWWYWEPHLKENFAAIRKLEDELYR